jgi:hypothetical protein
MSCLRCLWLFGCIDVQHVLCFSSSCVPYVAFRVVFRCLVLPVSLECLLIRRSVFYNVYLRHLVDAYIVQSNIM